MKSLGQSYKQRCPLTQVTKVVSKSPISTSTAQMEAKVSIFGFLTRPWGCHPTNLITRLLFHSDFFIVSEAKFSRYLQIVVHLLKR